MDGVEVPPPLLLRKHVHIRTKTVVLGSRCGGAPGLRLHATWQSGGGDGGEGRVGERRRREEKIGVIIMCLQYALYNAIKMSLSRTVCGGYNLCF